MKVILTEFLITAAINIWPTSTARTSPKSNESVFDACKTSLVKNFSQKLL